jgi:uncharacterized protein (TIGR03435 family)
MTKLLITLLACGVACAQPKHFEVASVKPSAPGGRGCNLNSTFSNLQIRPTDCPVKTLITAAWSLAPWELEVTRAPVWISSDHYDINAKSPSPTSARGLTSMLGPLLEDRFKLKWHREKKQIAVYCLTAAKGGVKLTATKPGSCIPFDHNSPPPPPIPGNPTSCDYILFPGTPDRLGMSMEGIGVPMSSVASRLSGLLGRPVVDNTGLSGVFDIHMKFARDSSLAIGGLPDDAAHPAEPSGAPNIFTAIRSVGLVLTAGKGPVDVFVVDSIQRPSEN